MHFKKVIPILFFILFFTLLAAPLSGFSAPVPDPTEQMKPFLAKMTKILAESDMTDKRQCSICKRLLEVSRERFDYNEMSKRVLGKAWRKLSKQEREEFVDLFTKLLQYAYIGKIEDYAGQTIEFKKQRIKGKRAEVKTELIDKNNSIPVSYIMMLKGDQWMAYDVVVEGVSLIRNYMEQFRQILRKEKYSGLVLKIKDKIKELENERAKLDSNE
jgi:phospholipid transport system substrate-binding protein